MPENTVNPSLIVDVLRERVITVLQPKLSTFNAYSIDFGADPMYPKRKVQVRKVTSAPDTVQNATDFEPADNTTVVDNIEVVVNQETQLFHVSNLDMQTALRVRMLMDANLNKFFQKLTQVAMAPIEGGGTPPFTNYSNNPVDVATWDEEGAKGVWKEMFGPGPAYLTLSRPYWGNLIPANRDGFNPEGGAWGFDAIYWNEHLTSSAGATGGQCVGFGSHPQAIGLASGIPADEPPSDAYFIDRQIINTDILGISFEYRYWYATRNRKYWMSFDIMFGSAAGDTTQGALVTMRETV